MLLILLYDNRNSRKESDESSKKKVAEIKVNCNKSDTLACHNQIIEELSFWDFFAFILFFFSFKNYLFD